MSTIIEDGTGQGYFAKVDENNRLEVAIIPVDLHQISQDQGRAFSLYLKRDIATADTEEPLGVIDYQGSGRAVIVEMSFSLAVTDMTDTQAGRIEVHVIDGQTISNGTARTPLNMNRGSNVVADMTAVSGDAATLISGFTIDATTEVFHTYLRSDGMGSQNWRPDSAWLMEQNHKLLITAKGYTSGTALPGFRCTLRFYEEDLTQI